MVRPVPSGRLPGAVETLVAVGGDQEWPGLAGHRADDNGTHSAPYRNTATRRQSPGPALVTVKLRAAPNTAARRPRAFRRPPPKPCHLLTQILELAHVLRIDLTLAGDNAVVIGLAVLGLAPRERRIAILFGIIAPTVIRIELAVVALRLLAIIGLTLGRRAAAAQGVLADVSRAEGPGEPARRLRHLARRPLPGKLRRVIIRIVLADLSMSLDNVLAVAVAAGQHIWVLVTGRAVSVLLMGAAASLVARLLERFRWIAWIGLLIVLGVSIELIVKSSHQVLPLLENAS
nr:hypothetical protein [uncultured Lichenicoccus sp.]